MSPSTHQDSPKVPEAVEAAASVAYENNKSAAEPAWDQLAPALQDVYRQDTLMALERALPIVTGIREGDEVLIVKVGSRHFGERATVVAAESDLAEERADELRCQNGLGVWVENCPHSGPRYFGYCDLVPVRNSAYIPVSALLSDEATDAFWKAFEIERPTVDDRVRAGLQAVIEQVGGGQGG